MGHIKKQNYEALIYVDLLEMFFRPLSILLSICLLFANFSSAFVYMGYGANQEFIAKVLCENRNKSKLHCEGKCYLMKKLKQAQEKEQKQERQSQKPQVEDAVVNNSVNFNQYSFAEIIVHVPFSLGMPQSIRNSIFHPPQ